MTSMLLLSVVAAVVVDKATNANRIVRTHSVASKDDAKDDEDDGAAPANWAQLYSNSASKVLGKGAFGIARLVHLDGDTCTGEDVVAKSVKVNFMMINYVMTELAIMSEVKHPNLMGLFDYTPKTKKAILDAEEVTIMMAPAYGGEMDERYITNMTSARAPTGVSSDVATAVPGFFGSTIASVVDYIGGAGDEDYGPRDKYAAKLMCDTASGLARLHELGYVHRDLKPQNIWASHEECLGNEECRFIIGDFGLSAKVADANTIAGTPQFMPPEVEAMGNQNVVRATITAQLYKCYNSCSGLLGWKVLTYKSADAMEKCKEECEKEHYLPTGGWTQKGDVFGLGQTFYYTLTSAQYNNSRHGQLYGAANGLVRLGAAVGAYQDPKLYQKGDDETPSQFENRKAAAWGAKMEFAKAIGQVVVGGKLVGTHVPIDHRVADLPKPLVELLMSMLAGDMEARPTAAEVRDAACALADLPVRSAPATPPCVAACHALACQPDEQCRPSTATCEKPTGGR